MKTRTLRRAAPMLAALAVLTGLGAAASAAQAQTGPDYAAYGQYGEIARFGGFDTTVYSDNADLSALTHSQWLSGDFVDPVGFTVDAGNNNNVYVLDRVTAAVETKATTTTTWRLQELTSAGTPVADSVVTLAAPNGDTTDSFQLVGLAVDDDTGLVYALVDEYNATAAANEPYELIAWSANGLGTPAAGLSSDTSGDAIPVGLDPVDGSAPGVVSDNYQISTGEASDAQALYNPQGIAIDDQSDQDAVVIEASGASAAYTRGKDANSTIVQQVATSGSSIGSLLDGWSSAVGEYGPTGAVLQPDTLASYTDALSTAESTLGPAGISSTPAADNPASTTGTVTVLLDDSSTGGGDEPAGSLFYGDGLPSSTDVVSLPASLGSATVVAGNENATTWPSVGDHVDIADGVAIDTDGADPPYAVKSATALTVNAGPQIVALNNGLYAADYVGYSHTHQDTQVLGETSTGPKPGYWNGGTAAANLASEGVRLLAPEADGTLSNSTPPLTSVYDTLGNDLAGDTCSIDNFGVSAAAGSAGSVFVLTRGWDSSTTVGTETTAGRQIVEFAPTTGSNAQQPDTGEDAAAGACPTASGTFDLYDSTTGTASDEQQATDPTTQAVDPLTIKLGDQVTFDAAGSVTAPALSYPGASGADGDTAYPFYNDATTGTAAPYSFEWDPGDGSTPTADWIDQTGVALAPWPAMTQTYTYTSADVYHPTLTVTGDYGTYTTQQGEVIVQAGGPPTAVLPSSVTGTVNQPVTLDGSGSSPYSGASISNYHWDCGNGQMFDTTTPTEMCTYGTAGTYTATLTVRDDDQQQSSAVPETVTINPAATVANNPPPATTTTPPPTTTTKTTPPPVLKLLTPPVDVLKPGVTSAALVLQVKSVKVGAKLTVKLTEPKAKGSKSASAKVKTGSVKVGAGNLLHFSTGKLPVGVTVIRFYETVGKGKKAKQVLVKTETVRVSTKKK